MLESLVANLLAGAIGLAALVVSVVPSLLIIQAVEPEAVLGVSGVRVAPEGLVLHSEWYCCQRVYRNAKESWR